MMMKSNGNGNSSTFTVHDRLGAAIAPNTNNSTGACSMNLSTTSNCQTILTTNNSSSNLLSATTTTTTTATIHCSLTSNNSSSSLLSAAASPNGSNQHQDLVNLFECPVCFDYALPPILQCQSGHFVCSQCRQKLSSCPTCRGPLGNIRNLGMEKVADTILFPCKYQTNGCHLSLTHKQKLEHEESCDFRPVSSTDR